MGLDKRWHRVGEPHRTLRTGMRGVDVAKFQNGLNRRLDHIEGGKPLKLRTDGEFGARTLKAWQKVRFAIGLPERHNATRRAQLNVRRPWTRSRAAVKRARHRRAELKQSDREAAIRWALAQVGTVEQPSGSNSGPEISDWIRAGGGVPGWAWCQYFANAVAVKGGCPQLPTGYTVFVLNGNYRHLGFVPIPVSEARPGDMLFFKFPGVSNDRCDHVGIKIGPSQTVEGNTSSGNSGSQNNGGGVFKRGAERNPYIVGAVRVPYKD